LISRLTLLAIAVFAHVDAAGAANVAEGEKLARKVCVTCHIVAPGVGPAQVTAGIPSFMSIADKPDQTATQIQAKILNPHPPMPQVQLTIPELDNLATYIMSLKSKP
jgi:mono/diheme cytochrome c family protein